MKTKLLLSAAVVLISMMPAIATIHIINFGGALGSVYSPNSLAVQVGDTITWMGAFSTHPLESVSVPGGAAVFGSGSGTSFSYPVLVAGNYDYHCAIHGSFGMTGQFTATPSTGIGETASADVKIFPAITGDWVNIALSNHSGDKHSIELLNIQGQLMNKLPPFTDNAVQFDLSPFPNGIYFLVVRNENEIMAVRKVEKQ